MNPSEFQFAILTGYCVWILPDVKTHLPSVPVQIPTDERRPNTTMAERTEMQQVAIHLCVKGSIKEMKNTNNFLQRLLQTTQLKTVDISLICVSPPPGNVFNLGILSTSPPYAANEALTELWEP